jgi:uncharacterized phage protein (TIGR01671 family)
MSAPFSFGQVLNFNDRYIKSIGSDHVIMQYTGMKDKDGKEIWEGDVLQEVRLDGSLLHYKVWKEEGGFVVNQFQDDFYKPVEQIHFWAGLSDMQTASFVNGSCTVIGNIYQHPHLITTK